MEGLEEEKEKEIKEKENEEKKIINELEIIKKLK